MNEKKCSICQEIKSVTEFYKHYNKKPGWTLSHCKSCNYKKYQRPSNIKRLEKQGSKPKIVLTPEEKIERMKQRLKHYNASEKGKEAKLRYIKKIKQNKLVTVKVPKPKKIKTHEQIEFERQKKREYKKAYYRKTKAVKEKKTTDIILKKLNKSIRRRFKKALDGNKSGGKAVMYLGCTISELKAYLATLFTEGMSWDNYGLWHIDHIKPLCSFNLTIDEEIKKACHYSNLRPLWALDNIKKAKEDVKLKFVTN